MFVRVNTIFGKRDKIDDGIAHLEGADRAAVEGAPGNRGLRTLVDRSGGVIVAMSYWDELAQSSEAVLTRAREGAAAAAEGDLVAETYELTSQKHAEAEASDPAVRLTKIRIESATIAAGLEFLSEQVLSRLSAGHGFRDGELLLDRQSGSGLLLSTWTDEGDAGRGEAALAELGAQARQVGVTFPRTESYALVGMSAQAV